MAGAKRVRNHDKRRVTLSEDPSALCKWCQGYSSARCWLYEACRQCIAR